MSPSFDSGMFSTGWVKDFPDHRDYHLDSPAVARFVVKGIKDSLPKAYVLPDLAPPRAQLSIGSCTAHAGTYLFETHQRYAGTETHDLSRLFLYKTTRNLMMRAGDTGAHLRTTMQSMAMLGVPPESYWQYDVSKYDDEPTAFIYALAHGYQAMTYYRLDPFGADQATVLDRIRSNVALNRACMFGFVVYSFDSKSGAFFLPSANESPKGSHAVVVVGYDDGKEIVHPSKTATVGALRVANWWGSDWGDGGFGYVPYDFVMNGMATDWWTMMSAEWIGLDVFFGVRKQTTS